MLQNRMLKKFVRVLSKKKIVIVWGPVRNPRSPLSYSQKGFRVLPMIFDSPVFFFSISFFQSPSSSLIFRYLYVLFIGAYDALGKT
ncbi:hypothetical protein K450DRAFT_232414 [Umbelopsis ramanniana AG]|uniref:Uncharacterized protein n=1 Tax=Umbelopsis ramanniana AG TaxID=1314678 RepID=A0AAD5ECR7_UMBRA|nr:uncharacterized protein K450DRAFT_232414 [Umbelopsis ramanniana AG]KAI8581303.1 hypothetical protein K450DRAFT_232414 [Umbelopsis ramanniana AG]